MSVLGFSLLGANLMPAIMAYLILGGISVASVLIMVLLGKLKVEDAEIPIIPDDEEEFEARVQAMVDKKVKASQAVVEETVLRILEEETAPARTRDME
eukprot:CAMPEP_0182584620 /NCGR_PEP_ID=MMETSP1324-20130603/58302_1 /TAXON_ID=236786 /ORGANISM="Florenciella sp., Strain RCC1587" /LENGTH=97 /DNA_ID=CAMNT_0024801343 /DNA_START=90 /DNA_END=381 /DNA_ORIENTATION=-